MNRECELFMQDPEAHAAHAETCADCRSFAEDMHRLESKLGQASLQSEPLLADRVASSLPVASWEGASHRAWPTVIAAAVAIIALAFAVSMMAGVSLVNEIVVAVRGWISGTGAVMTLLRSVPKFADRIPAGIRITIIVLFVAVNALLVALLRRSPKGYDAPTR